MDKYEEEKEADDGPYDRNMGHIDLSENIKKFDELQQNMKDIMGQK